MSTYYVFPIEDELYHYGVKGMKWGVRRTPEELGHRTKNRYGMRDGSDKHHANDSNMEAGKLALSIALDVLSLNPVGLVLDSKRLIQAGISCVRDGISKDERSKSERDPKTGFLLKKNSMSMSQDAAKVNPNFHNFNTNTKNNCMLCTSTYDLRRRGFEVRAKTASVGYTNDDLTRWYPKATINKITGESNNSFIGDRKLAKQVVSELTSQGDGARGNLMFSWRGSFSGHSVAYEVSNGKVSIIDSQINKVYNNAEQYLMKAGQTVQYARLDNVDFNPNAIKEVAE